jgi:hypothetical protein
LFAVGALLKSVTSEQTNPFQRTIAQRFRDLAAKRLVGKDKSATNVITETSIDAKVYLIPARKSNTK